MSPLHFFWAAIGPLILSTFVATGHRVVKVVPVLMRAMSTRTAIVPLAVVLGSGNLNENRFEVSRNAGDLTPEVIMRDT